MPPGRRTLRSPVCLGDRQLPEREGRASQTVYPVVNSLLGGIITSR
jgi:hypothetical protein